MGQHIARTIERIPISVIPGRPANNDVCLTLVVDVAKRKWRLGGPQGKGLPYQLPLTIAWQLVGAIYKIVFDVRLAPLRDRLIFRDGRVLVGLAWQFVEAIAAPTRDRDGR